MNGAQGIAVGMATNIPPHNLAEVCNAAVKLIDKPDVTLSELMRIVKGPDFPTGGLIMGDDGIKDAFRTGRGTVRVRARARDRGAPARGGQAIVLTEVPFQTSVDAISGKLAELVLVGEDRRRARHPQRVGAGQDPPRHRAARPTPIRRSC